MGKAVNQLLHRIVSEPLLQDSNFQAHAAEQAEFVRSLLDGIPPERIAALADEIREKRRHTSLLLVRELARRKDAPKGLVRTTLEKVIHRVDDITEFMVVYQMGRGPEKQI